MLKHTHIQNVHTSLYSSIFIHRDEEKKKWKNNREKNGTKINNKYKYTEWTNTQKKY